MLATPWGARVIDAGPDAQRAFVERGVAFLQPQMDADGTATVPFTANLVTARRPGPPQATA